MDEYQHAGFRLGEGEMTFINCYFHVLGVDVDEPAQRFTTCPLCRRIVWHDADDPARLGAHDGANRLSCPNAGERWDVLYPSSRG